MTPLQEQEERDNFYGLWAEYAELVKLTRNLRMCGTKEKPTDERICPCADCIIIRRSMKFRDRAWNAYGLLCQNGESASQEIVEAAIPKSEKEAAA